MNEFCTFWMDALHHCNRQPVQADYWSVDPIRGERLIASLCSLHDQARARQYAMAKSMERRTRKPDLQVVPEPDVA